MAASSLSASSFVMPRAAVPLDFSDINWTVRELLGIVSEVTGVTVRDLRADRRCKDLVRARHIACWLSRNFTLLNHRTIGRHIGDRDHTTILYALGRVEAVRAHHGIAFVEDPAAMARALWAVAWPRYQR